MDRDRLIPASRVSRREAQIFPHSDDDQTLARLRYAVVSGIQKPGGHPAAAGFELTQHIAKKQLHLALDKSRDILHHKDFRLQAPQQAHEPDEQGITGILPSKTRCGYEK